MSDCTCDCNRWRQEMGARITALEGRLLMLQERMREMGPDELWALKKTDTAKRARRSVRILRHCDRTWVELEPTWVEWFGALHGGVIVWIPTEGRHGELYASGGDLFLDVSTENGRNTFHVLDCEVVE